ncbi:hypothetical protein QR680_013591 [Steinernema hermaphroditum]|uniref:Peptidase S1 domain-containing protein n=1 Tax=Steinernema hermaphroditum TaxID=289476 RepID=A0AA39I8U6_9BILA|nr:hypothetical protein QR680_013591 [Steinernema hermaphroditum]
MRSLLLLVFVGLSSASPLPLPRNVEHELFVNVTKGLVHPSELIFGGSTAERGQFPAQVFLLMTNTDGDNYICGGSLLTTRHVLTAAHCTEKLVAPSYAMLGLVDITTAQRTPGVQIKKVKSFANHPDYDGDGNSVHDDIGVITLESEVELSDYVKTVQIKKEDGSLLEDKKETVSGFGTYMFKNDEPVTSRVLRFVQVDHIDYDWCKRRWARMTGNRVHLWEKQICAGNDGKGSGPGDSGGPLQVRTADGLFQVGLVSFGVKGTDISMNQADFPAVYTRVAKYCDFIADKTDGAYKCL